MKLDPESRIRYSFSMTSHVADAELLREENTGLRAVLADRDGVLAQKDQALAAQVVVVAEKDQTIAALEEALATIGKELRLSKDEIEYLRRRLFGRSSEKLLEGPTLFDGLADPEPPKETAPDDEASTLGARETKPPRKKPTGRKPIPAHFPRTRIEIELPQAERHCDACGSERVRIGEETSEIVNFVPATFNVDVHVRGKYACRCGEGGVVTPPLPLVPPSPIPGSYAGPSLVAQVLVAKFDDHLPLYRQAEIFRRSGLDLARSTLCDWIGGVMPLLTPVVAEMTREIVAGTHVQADETPVQVAEGEKRKHKQAYLWVYRGKGQVVFDFRLGRGRDGPSVFLKDFRGTLQTDAYVGYDEVIRDNHLIAMGCVAHARRKFNEALESSPNEAALVLVVIRRLYKIEDKAAGLSDAERLHLRTVETKPHWDNLKLLIERLASTAVPSSRLGKACSYALTQWTRLSVFLTDGAVDIDNNATERSVRGVAVGRRNWLFCGSEEGGRRAAVVYSLIESCKAAGVEPFAYLTDLLTRLPSATISQIASFTPRAWAAARRV